MSFSRVLWYIWPASSSRLWPPTASSSRRSGRPTSPINRVSPVNTARLWPSSSISKMRNAVGRVAGGIHGVQLHGAQGNAVAVVEGFVRVVGPHQLAAVDGGAGFLGNFQVRRHEVGVRMGLDNGYDGGVVLVGEVVVGLRVAGRVDDGDLAAAADGVAGVGQALIIKLLNLYRPGTTRQGAHGGRLWWRGDALNRVGAADR